MSGNVTRRAALALISSGAVISGSETFGFTNLTGTRSVNVATADDSEALLGIVDNSENIGQVKDTPETIFYIDNNSDTLFNFIDSSAHLVDYVNCTSNCPDVYLDTADNHDYAVVVNCGGSNISQIGRMTVQIEMIGSEVSVNTARTTNYTIETKCNGNTGGGGFSSVSASNISQGGTQTLSFSPSNSKLESGDTVTIDLTGVSGVDYSNADWEVTSGPGNGNNTHGSVSFENGLVKFEASRQVKSDETVRIDVTNYTITGSPGEEYTAFFKRSGNTGSDDFSIES